ncbi:sugar phosphate isomerase/epimerase [Sphingomonas sp. C8-2]|jgi:sugar phosphate isomerase/epimerase|uniref:Sugar phosphate isomerase/epimerase n=1 Tax=Rhizorhabdus histidinilytica TaxID=439228 RepID=A0A1T5EVV5_9SPHN|nr:sugar phosphate isomerase/epimerase [Rhizorhabdus histidinilytica]QEH76993.1 sugar phosphate isomerase/epimerase [Sphingomonas sp. C8-2]SKB87978.1 Sugar phosphate isomerase/epimerase [Rhizorhabdus histidinilytica]
MSFSRREAAQLLFAAPAAALALKPGLAAALTPVRPNSKWAGVQVGLNVPYSFGTRTALSAEQVLHRTVALGISAVELRIQPIEISLGLPQDLVLGPAPSDYRAVYYPKGDSPEILPPAPGRTTITQDYVDTYKIDAARRRDWRLGLPIRSVEKIRRMYDDAGVRIEIVKFDGINDFEGEELDYMFDLAKAIGARAVSGEMAIPAIPKLAAAADKHRFMVGLHNHLAITPAMWEDAFRQSRYLGANVDIGHFLAGNQTSPLPFIKQHHDRITHLHVKDKTLANVNVAFGAGDTPVREILQTIRDNKWDIQATIEYEIPLDPAADRDAEIRKAIAYCRRCLLG